MIYKALYFLKVIFKEPVARWSDLLHVDNAAENCNYTIKNKLKLKTSY